MSLLGHVAVVVDGRRRIPFHAARANSLVLLILRASPGKWTYSPYKNAWIENELEPADKE